VSTFDEAVGSLRPKVLAVRAFGAELLASFGAVARGEARPDSDADVLVRFVEGGTADDRYLDLAELHWNGTAGCPGHDSPCVRRESPGCLRRAKGVV